MLAHGQIGIHQSTGEFSPDAGLCSSPCGTSHALVDVPYHLIAEGSSGVSGTFPSFFSSADLLRAHPVSLPQSLMKVDLIVLSD